MTLLVHPSASPAQDGTILRVTPSTAGWEYVGFEVLRLDGNVVAQRDTGEREVCIVVIAGRVDIESDHAAWRGVGGREDPWSGPPDGAYLPPNTHFGVRASPGGDGSEVEVVACAGPRPATVPLRACSRARRSSPRRAGTRPSSGRSTRS